MEKMALIEPTSDLTAEFRAMAAEWREAGEDKFKDAFGDFAQYVKSLQKQRETEGLPADRVPGSTFWLVSAGRRVVGTSRLRHWLVPHLEKEGGHIGYDIRPSERRKGYGTTVLALTLGKARDLGLRSVIVTCDADNLGSVRIIEKNGGRSIGTAVSECTGKEVSRYQITLG